MLFRNSLVMETILHHDTYWAYFLRSYQALGQLDIILPWSIFFYLVTSLIFLFDVRFPFCSKVGIKWCLNLNCITALNLPLESHVIDIYCFYLAFLGPTLPMSKEDDAVRSASGMSPDSIPNGLVQSAVEQYQIKRKILYELKWANCFLVYLEYPYFYHYFAYWVIEKILDYNKIRLHSIF